MGSPIAEWLSSGLSDKFDVYTFTLPTPNLHLQLSGYTNNTPGSAIGVTLSNNAAPNTPINGTLNIQASGMTADYSGLAAGQYSVQLALLSTGQTNYHLAVSAS